MKAKSVLSICCMILTQGLYAHVFEEKEEDFDFIEQIARHETSCVKHIEQGKIYLHAERLHPTNQGLYLHLAHEDYIPVPSLHSDAKGCFVNSVLNKKVTKKCPLCGREYLLICPNKECPTNQKKQK